MSHPPHPILPVAGWCEIATFPSLGVEKIAVKLDTGAKTSALHVVNVETFSRDGKEWVRFGVHPLQDNDDVVIHCESPVHKVRTIKSSNGQQETRYTILTSIRMAGMAWPIEVSLTNRDAMGFRVLLGRRAMRNRLIIDPHRTYILTSHLNLEETLKATS